MVASVTGLVHGKDRCVICDKQLALNQQCIFVVHYPYFESQSFCMACYSLMSAAAMERLKAMPDMSDKDVLQYVQRVLADVEREIDSQVMDP